MDFIKISSFFLATLIFFVMYWLVKSTLKEGRKALDEIKNDNNKSS